MPNAYMGVGDAVGLYIVATTSSVQNLGAHLDQNLDTSTPVVTNSKTLSCNKVKMNGRCQK